MDWPVSGGEVQVVRINDRCRQAQTERTCPSSSGSNTVLGNLKTSLSGGYHAFDFRKYAARYGALYRFDRRFDLRTLHTRKLLVAAANLSG